MHHGTISTDATPHPSSRGGKTTDATGGVRMLTDSRECVTSTAAASPGDLTPDSVTPAATTPISPGRPASCTGRSPCADVAVARSRAGERDETEDLHVERDKRATAAIPLDQPSTSVAKFRYPAIAFKRPFEDVPPPISARHITRRTCCAGGGEAEAGQGAGVDSTA